MRTVLENPTRYHVIQKQKSQVRQYLSESFQGDSLEAAPARTSRARRSAASSAPAAAHLRRAATAAATATATPTQQTAADRVMSPGQSSVTTSVSEVGLLTLEYIFVRPFQMEFEIVCT